METLYGLKRKTTNRWLKFLLLLFVAVGFGIPNLNAQTKAIKVANDKQLIQAINNPSVGTIMLEAGYYPTLNTYAESGTKVVKKVNEGGNRDQQCQYWIVGANTCFNPTPPETFVENIAVAGYTDTYSCGCCPGPDAGAWSVTSQPIGSTVNFIDPINTEFMTFEVDMPGSYLLRYTWGAPYNSLVETEFYFYGPVTVELSAPDVCGTLTTVDFELSSIYPDPSTTVVWTLDDAPYAGPDETAIFDLAVSFCGQHELSVTVTPSKCPPVTKTIIIDFACQPIADAGPDVNVCDEICYYSLVGSYGGVLLSPTHAWSWVELSSPPDVDLVFDNQTELVTGVCADDLIDDCPYGEFEVEFQVQNGECYDSDTMLIRFYQQPTANAGPDQNLCNIFSFSLAAVPFDYCGAEDVNYWSDHYWVVVSQADPDAIINFVPDIYDPQASVYISSSANCPYGKYEFKWVEKNSMGENLGGCEAEDNVVVTIFEDPEIDAGEDQEFCSTFAFSLYGVGDTPCYTYTEVLYSWVLISQPDGCTVEFFESNELQPSVEISGCPAESCPYGEYIFKLTQSNGYLDDLGEFVPVCSTEDNTSVWIYEDPDADAGPDYWTCSEAATTFYTYYMAGNSQMDYCYTMFGVWTKSCGPGTVIFDDINDPQTLVTFPKPGRYIFTWTLSNDQCEDSDDVVFDLLEQPEAIATYTEDVAECDDLCYTLGDLGIVKYEYIGTEDGDCPNFWDRAHWSYVDGPVNGYLDPTTVIFADDTDPATELCVSYYGAYTVRWNEVNKPDDKDYECSDYVDVFIEFYETPVPDAGDDAELCGNCYTLVGVPYEYLPYPNQHLSDYYYWEALASNPCDSYFDNYESAITQVCIPDIYPYCYGTYGYVLHESNGICTGGTDTVYITFNKKPEPMPVCFDNNPNYCGPENNGPDFDFYGCLEPGGLLEVCAEGCTEFYLHPDCYCNNENKKIDIFSWYDPAYYGWTFEWSVIAPAGTSVQSGPGWYDFENGWWNYPWIDICWGECCDTARIYLTITTPDGCETTMEYKAYVYHKPCIDIAGPEISEVGAVVSYCNNCEPIDPTCLLYTWTAEHCGEIVGGQGSPCIDVLWTDYNVNDGWGEITLTVFDTCTGCCNYEEMLVKIWPTGTLGSDTLAGHVYYHNAGNTPLNGVEIQLWNGGIPVQTATSFNDVEGGNGVGYFVFPGISDATEFGITASYDAPWYGNNATDALAVQLQVIGQLPPAFDDCDLVLEAMDVNNSTTISATDALWIKQRAINMVNYFPVGDWVWTPDMVSYAGTYDIYTLNAGDATRDNIPNSMKVASVDLITDGTRNVVAGQEFELPIRVADANQFGAITLDLGYNSALIEVVDVVPMDGMLVNLTEGNVSIAWSNVSPMNLVENDVVVTLKVKAISPTTGELQFSVGSNSEFADANANVIKPVTLKTYGISTEAAATDYFLSTNRPNPFSTSTFIEYTLPESGKVTLSVLDMLGQEMAVLVNATQDAGSYTVKFSAAGLATGVYLYKITVDGETRDFISTQRMVISQ